METGLLRVVPEVRLQDQEARAELYGFEDGCSVIAEGPGDTLAEYSLRRWMGGVLSRQEHVC